jgi:hypothetical protein
VTLHGCFCIFISFYISAFSLLSIYLFIHSLFFFSISLSPLLSSLFLSLLSTTMIFVQEKLRSMCNFIIFPRKNGWKFYRMNYVLHSWTTKSYLLFSKALKNYLSQLQTPGPIFHFPFESFESAHALIVGFSWITLSYF